MSKPRVRIGTLPALVSLLFITAGVLVQISQTSCRPVAKQTPSASSGESLTVLPDVPVDSNLVLHVTVRAWETRSSDSGRKSPGSDSGRKASDSSAVKKITKSKYMVARAGAAPMPMKDVQPVYPNQARASAVEGTAMVNLRVTENGGVDSVGVYQSSGSPLLDDAALDAALKSTFIPANHGEAGPVAMWVRRPFRFSLGPAYYFDELVSRPQDRPKVFTLPSPLGYVPPEYPDAARRKGEEGTVVIGMRLRKDGTVSGVRLRKSSGHRLLDSAALSVALKSDFTPARDSSGDAVEALVARTVNFLPKRQ